MRRAPKTAAQAQIQAAGSVLENEFVTLWSLLGGPPLVREYRFDPARKWRFDFVLEDLTRKVAIEIEGGTFQSGRHTQGKGYSLDCQKYNQAIARGWQVFRLTADLLHDDPTRHLGVILDFVGRQS